jgi:hypothetical protein
MPKLLRMGGAGNTYVLCQTSFYSREDQAISLAFSKCIGQSYTGISLHVLPSMMLPREVETGPDHQLTSLALRNEPISSLVEHAAAHFLIGPDIGLTWTKLDDQAGDPPGFLGV